MGVWLVFCAVAREDTVFRMHTDFCQAQGSGLPTCSLPLAHTWQRGLGQPPTLPPGLQPPPMGPWETLYHTSGHQNSSLVFNHSPFEAVPRKIPCPLTGFQVGSFGRAEQWAASQRLSIALDFFHPNWDFCL